MLHKKGIGARGTRLTHEKVLSEETVKIIESKKNEYIKLAAGIHRFPFAFIVPNVSLFSPLLSLLAYPNKPN